jgi:two-component system NarL family response regulator
MKIMIVDDHVLFREGLASIISHEKDITIAGLAGSVKDAVELADQTRPDIVLMDFGLPDGTGADAARAILSNHPACKIVFLTMSEEDEHLFSAVRSGAVGYLLKNMRPANLVAAIRAVHHGESAISRTMTLRLLGELAHPGPAGQPDSLAGNHLTPREKEILRELADGGSNKEIAQRLFISENTVKYHVHALLGKLNVKDRTAAAEYARAHGLVK